MKNLALSLPGGNQVDLPDLSNQGQGKVDPTKFNDLASFISPLLNIIFYVVAFLAFYYLIWGAFQYLMARGNKEELGKARARITWAIIGIIVTFSAYLIAKYASEIFAPTQGGLPF